RRRRLEEVCATARAVADVVAHQVCNDGGVARVGLRDTCLDFTDKVSAHVSGLRVDSAAELGEEGDEAGPEAEANDQERRDRLRVAQHFTVDEEDTGDAE